jgi:hypothetical protein
MTTKSAVEILGCRADPTAAWITGMRDHGSPESVALLRKANQANRVWILLLAELENGLGDPVL